MTRAEMGNIFTEELHPFSLMDRVYRQYGASLARQHRRNFHITGIRLGFIGMPREK